MTIPEIEQRIQRAEGARERVQSDLARIEKQATDLFQRQKDIEEAQALIQVTAKETQEKLRYHIEDIVNTALDTCFPGEYSFIVDFQIKRGRTEADMYLDKEGERINPMDATGGGVVDIISFALRLAAWTLSRTDNIIVLDEPFKFLSTDLRPLAGEILQTLSRKLGIQMLIVTHDQTIIDVSDTVFEVSQKKGKSSVKVKGTGDQEIPSPS